MGTALFTCFGTVVAIVGAVITFVYVVIPLLGLFFVFIGRLFRFVWQEFRDILLLPTALLVAAVKVCSVIICIVLGRWDIVRVEKQKASKRFAEVRDRCTALFIDNPLQLFGIQPATTTQKPLYAQQVHDEIKDAVQQVQDFLGPHTQSQRSFQGYTIVGTLPSGGSGAKLYIVQKEKTHEKFVIKYFDITSGSILPQIVRESKAMECAKRLGLVIEHHLDESCFWYAMPFHDGEHLGLLTNKQHASAAKLTTTQLVSMLTYQRDLLKTLHQYHTAGLWHKDVKPDNIIIHDGGAHLVDLGLITPLASAMTLTTHGTEYYRDPELVRQAMRGVKVHQVNGAKFDVYGAGAVLYFMLENTFPAHGALSDFSKESPEGIRWIVRRAMADYDKRYDSVEEMLGDVLVVLQAKNISNVRPADLPSVTGRETVVQGTEATKMSARRLPKNTTPSTGGGPFTHAQNKTKPFGLIALLAAIAIGVFSIILIQPELSEPVVVQPSPVLQNHEQPGGPVLLINELPLQSERLQALAQSTSAQLQQQGWNIVVDQDVEARVRTWLPVSMNSIGDPSKLFQEGLVGIIVLRNAQIKTIEAVLLEENKTTTFSIAEDE